MSVCPSVRMEHFDYQGQIFMKSDIWLFFENLSTTFKCP
jgi:hypothetical protein